MERHEEMHVKRIKVALESRHVRPGRRRRGFSSQRLRREAERCARKDAITIRRLTLLQGGTNRDAAACLEISPRTLSDWERKWRQDRLREKPRGRPLKQADPLRRGEFIEVLNGQGPQRGLRPLRVLFPDMARGEILDVLWRFRRIFARRNRLVVHSLSWDFPGSVWAMDHTDVTLPVDGIFKRIFAVRDLGSNEQVLWLPVEDATAPVTIRALELLFLHHGPPLVLKSDNGPAFISEEMSSFLKSWEVIQLLSPPWTPQYNGACEAGIGSMEIRTRWEAVRNGRWIDWNWEDMERARIQANQTQRGIGFPAPEEVWNNRPAISPEFREAFRSTVREEEIKERMERGIQPEAELEPDEQSSIDRVSIRRALVAHVILRFRKRDVPLPIKKIFRAKIS